MILAILSKSGKIGRKKCENPSKKIWRQKWWLRNDFVTSVSVLHLTTTVPYYAVIIWSFIYYLMLGLNHLIWLNNLIDINMTQTNCSALPTWRHLEWVECIGCRQNSLQGEKVSDNRLQVGNRATSHRFLQIPAFVVDQDFTFCLLEMCACSDNCHLIGISLIVFARRPIKL